jgi:hypothetical protein
MKDVDVYMRESMDKYMNNDNFRGWFSEYNAASIVNYLIIKKDPDAIKVKPVMITEQDIKSFKNRFTELTTALYQQRSSTRELERFETNDYDNFIIWYGRKATEDRKNILTKKKDKYLKEYNNTKLAYDSELNKFKKNAPQRISAYIELRGVSFSGSNDDPVVLLNKVIADVNKAYPEYSFPASDMNDQVLDIYGNYESDIKYLNSVHSLLTDLSDNLIHDLEKKVNYKERQKEIQEYYHSQYDQQIFLAKILILFSLFVVIGSILLHYQIIDTTAFSAYLGLVFSIAFMVFFYYLWDFYMRDNIVFDEYDFNTYLPPSNGKILRSTFKDNIIYC